jgi:hypothetical protein
MIGRGKMLGEVIGPIAGPLVPEWPDMSHFDTIFDPMVSHVPSFGTFRFHEIRDDSKGGSIVSLDRGRWLWVADGNEGITDGNGSLGVVEKSSTFGFGGRRYDTTKGAAFGV